MGAEEDAKKIEGDQLKDAARRRVQTEKKLFLIRAWEDREKSKAEKKSIEKLSAITTWENSAIASMEAELEKKKENKKAKYAEKTEKKIALLHKVAEEKRAIVEAQRRTTVLKVEETAAKYVNKIQATRPEKKLLCCFGA